MDPIQPGPDKYGDHARRTGTHLGGGTDSATPGDAVPQDAVPHNAVPHDAVSRAPGAAPSARGTAVAHIKGAGAVTTPPPVRTVQLISGDFLLTVNPVDGSEIELCPPGRLPAPPVRHTAEERVDLQRAGRPPVPPGPAAPPLPLLERGEERARLTELLGRGRSVRLTGPAGSGRTALLEAVAGDCADLAPDGVVRLSGHHRTATELLYELYAAVYRSPLARPDREGLRERVKGIGAVVVLDDLELGGEALGELLAATPECAYLLAATPATPEPPADAGLEEVALGGLGRGSSLELLENVVERALTDDEANWAGDLWFESEGLPLRFVQAGALLRRRDRMRGDIEAFDEFEPFERSAGAASDPAAQRPFAGVVPRETPDGYDIPLPSLGEGASPAALLASRLSEAARATLRFAVALGGEVPHQAHLPALVGDTHADAALGELMSCGLLTPVGARYRLAAGVAAQLTEDGYADDAAAHAHTAAQHYAWWAGHPSVTPERAVAEAAAILAAMAPLVPGTEAGHPSAAVLLARSAAPAFLAGLHWGAWERALRTGSEAARLAGEVAEEAYFHHDLGVLALCVGNPDRARAELEASIGMRGAVADKVGTVAGRRALALVADRERALSGGRTPAPPVRNDAPSPATFGTSGTAIAALPPAGKGAGIGSGIGLGAGLGLGPAAVAGSGAWRGSGRGPGAGQGTGPGMGSGPGVGSGLGPVAGPGAAFGSGSVEGMGTTRSDIPVVPGPAPVSRGIRRPVFSGAHRNLVAVGTGAVLAVVLGTVVTLGATSGNEKTPTDPLRTEQTTEPDDTADGQPTDQPVGNADTGPGVVPVAPGVSGSPEPSESGSPAASESPSATPSDGMSPGSTPSESPLPSDPATSPYPSDPVTPTESPEPTAEPTTSAPAEPPTTEPTDPPATDPPAPPTLSSGPVPSAGQGEATAPEAPVV
ncbi:ATP-binding protein [Streptomyces sp. NPDC087658]|uniref:ATP-binding protein n=1 Tax=Streptomyces sp. NPDC087658 TaxID=3365800 RepID=UPI00382B7AC1